MNLSVLRILDANFNRAREALRVVEDYARFVLNDGQLSEALKALRHELVGATEKWSRQAISFRDTAGDVGTSITTQAEARREDMSAVVTAAGKRLGEALRTIEEYLKTQSPDDAAAVEQIRYRFYDLEARIDRTLRPPGRFAQVRLYVLISQVACKRPWLEVARAAIEGGADCLQLREKELEGGELLQRARMLVGLCRKNNVLSIINDRPDIALLADADGVHVGQGDLPVVEARKLVGPDKIVGISTHNLQQAKQAVLDGADYVGVGPVFRSSTKTRQFLPGLEFAKQVAEEIPLPAVAIAGIDEENVEKVLETGIRAVAVTAVVGGSDEPVEVVKRLKERLSGNAGH